MKLFFLLKDDPHETWPAIKVLIKNKEAQSANDAMGILSNRPIGGNPIDLPEGFFFYIFQ